MVARIILARHGETDWNLEGKWQGNTDVPLNSRGIQQAKELAGKLSGVKIDRVYSSDLKRANDTAQVVADSKGFPFVTTDPRLRERHLGTFEGMTSTQICGELGIPAGTLSINRLGSNPSMETWEAFTRRINDALTEIGSVTEGKSSLVVAHGGVIMATNILIRGEDHTPRKFTNGEFMTVICDNGSLRLDRKTSPRANNRKAD